MRWTRPGFNGVVRHQFDTRGKIRGERLNVYEPVRKDERRGRKRVARRSVRRIDPDEEEDCRD
jgi:hypothetical protein